MRPLRISASSKIDEIPMTLFTNPMTIQSNPETGVANLGRFDHQFSEIAAAEHELQRFGIGINAH